MDEHQRDFNLKNRKAEMGRTIGELSLCSS